MISYRPADLEDRPLNTERRFILDAWARSFRTSHSAGFIAMERWYSVMIPELAATLSRPGVRTIVAYDPKTKDHIADLFGFIAAEPDVSPPLVLYAFTKEGYRRMGIARGLFGALGIDPLSRFDYACRTEIVSKLQRKVPLARWCPVKARFSQEKRRDE